jgi:hypothetical protein
MGSNFRHYVQRLLHPLKNRRTGSRQSSGVTLLRSPSKLFVEALEERITPFHNITIMAGGSVNPVDLTSAMTFNGGGAANDIILDPSLLNNATANIVLQANNDITFVDAVSITTAGVSLTGQAGRSILVNNNITTNAAALTFTANDTVADGVVDANRDAGTAVITLGAGNALSTGTGAISFTISSGPTTNNTSGGITLAAGSSLTTTDGGITLQATQGPATAIGNFVGVDVNGANITTTGTGNISLQGKGGNDAATGFHFGVEVHGGATVSSSGTGTVTLTGTGGSGTNANYGVDVQDAGTLITSVTGAISMTGQGGNGTADSNLGIQLELGAHVTSTGTGATAATIGLNGTGGAGTTATRGVDLAFAGTLLTSVDGNIAITGQGGTGSSDFSEGVVIQISAQLTSTGTGTITINGTGGSGTDNNNGVDIAQANALVTSATGNIGITGMAGNGTANSNVGVVVQLTGQVTSTGTGATAASITLVGTGGAGAGTNNNDGVRVGDMGTLASADGAIGVTGTAGIGAASLGVDVFGTSQITATGTGPISFSADSMGLSAASMISSPKSVTLQPLTGVAIDLGGPNGPGTLGLTNGELAIITTGLLQVGSAGSGNITVTAPITAPAGWSTLDLQTGGGIIQGGGSIQVTNLELQAVTGIGDAAALVTQVTNLAYNNSTSGQVQVSNTGGLTIAAVGALLTSANLGGATTLSAASPVTFAVNTTSAGTITANAVDDTAGPNNDNVTVNAGVTLQSTGGDVDFNAGDDIVITATATVSASGNVTFNSAFNDNDNEGMQTLNGTVSAGAATGIVTLNAGAFGPVTEAGTGTISGNQLLLLGTGAAGTFTLTSPTNAVANIAASTTGAISFTDTSALTVATVNATAGINTGGQDVTLTVTGNGLTIGTGAGESITAAGATVDLNAAGISEGANSVITSNNLRLQGNGTFTLGQNNVVNTLAAATSGGALSFTDTTNLTVGTVNGTAGINSTGQNVTLTISGGSLAVGSGAGEGITAAGATVDLQAAGIAEGANSVITSGSLRLQGSGVFTLTQNNVVSSLAANTSGGALSFTDTTNLTVGTVNGTAGINSAGQNVTLTVSGGSLTIGSGAGEGITAAAAIVDLQAAGISEGANSFISADSLRLQGNGTFTLTQNNVVNTLAANTSGGSLSFTDTTNLTVGTVLGTAGINSAGQNVTLTVSGGSLTIGMAAGESITAAGAIVDIQAAGVLEAANSIITSGSLRLQGSGAFSLNQNNAVGTLAANTSGGTLDFIDVVALVVDTVLATVGITSSNNDVTLCAPSIGLNQSITAGTGTVRLNTTAGDITENGAAATIVAANLGANAPAGSISLTSANNVPGNVAFNSGGTIDFMDVSAYTVGTVTASDNGCFPLTTGFTSNGNITICGPSITLTGPVNAGAANTVRLSATTGGVTQNAGATITAANLGVNAAGGAITLTEPTNNITGMFAALDSSAAVGSNVAFTDSVSFTVGSIGALGCFTTAVNGVTATAANTITLNDANAITVSAPVATGTGAITFNVNTSGAAGQNFTQNAGGTITTTAAAITINVNAATGTGAATLGDNISDLGGMILIDTDANGGNTTGGSITQTAGVLNVGNGGTITLTVPSAGASGIGPIQTQTAVGGAASFLNLTTGTGGAFVMNAGDITLGNLVLTTAAPGTPADAPLSLIATGTLTLPATAINTGTAILTLESLGGTLTNPGTLASTSGLLTLLGATGLTVASTVTTTTGNQTLSTTAAGSNLTINAATTSGSGNINATAIQDLTTSAVVSTMSGLITLMAGRDLSANANVTSATGNITATAGRNLTAGAVTVATGAALAFNAGGNVTFTNTLIGTAGAIPTTATVTGGGSSSILTVNDVTPSIFSVNAANVGVVTNPVITTVPGGLAWSALGNLAGGPADDTFAFNAGGSEAGNIDGMGGNNTLTYANFGTPVNVNLTALGAITAFNGTGNAIGGTFNNIGQAIGANAGLTNTLTDALPAASSFSPTWTVTKNLNTSTYISNNRGLNFASFEVLTAGSIFSGFNVEATNTVLTINGSPQGDTINVSSDPVHYQGTLDGIGGPLTLKLGTGFNNVAFGDMANATGKIVTLTNNQIMGFAGINGAQLVNYDASAESGGNLLLLGGSGGNTFNVLSTAHNANFTLIRPGTGAANNVNAGGFINDAATQAKVNSGQTQLAGMLSGITDLLNLQADGPGDVLNITDMADANNQTSTLTATTFTSNTFGAGGSIQYGGFGTLNISTSSGASTTTTIAGTATTTTNTINGNGGSNLSQVMATASKTNLLGQNGQSEFGFADGATLTGGLANGGTASVANTLNLISFTSPVMVNLTPQANNFGVAMAGANAIANLANIRTVIGGNGGSNLQGNNNDPNAVERLIGGLGTDIVAAGVGTDALYAGTLQGVEGTAPKTLVAGPGADTLIVNSCSDVISGQIKFDLSRFTGNKGTSIQLFPSVLATPAHPTDATGLSRIPLGVDPPAAAPGLSVVPNGNPLLPHRDAVVFGVLNSTEARADEIGNYYIRFLGRLADTDGMSYWQGRLAGGARQEDVMAGILGSDEYFNRHGGTNAGYVQGLYADLLGRGAGQSEIDYWVGQINGSSRGSVAYAIMASDEFRTSLIAGWYLRYLGRPVDADGLQTWLTDFAHGATQEQLQASLLLSAEYQQRVNSNYTDPNRGFILSIYHDVLGRAAQQSELDSWFLVLSQM